MDDNKIEKHYEFWVNVVKVPTELNHLLKDQRYSRSRFFNFDHYFTLHTNFAQNPPWILFPNWILITPCRALVVLSHNLEAACGSYLCSFITLPGNIKNHAWNTNSEQVTRCLNSKIYIEPKISARYDRWLRGMCWCWGSCSVGAVCSQSFIFQAGFLVCQVHKNNGFLRNWAGDCVRRAKQLLSYNTFWLTKNFQ